MQCAESAGTAVALVYSPFADFHRKGERWVQGRIRVPELPERDPALSLLAPENFLQIGSTLIRRSAWLEVSGMDESMPIVHDVNLYVRLAIAGHAMRMCKTVTPSLLFRQHPAGSLTTSSPSNFYADAERNADLVRNHYTAIGRMHEEHVQARLPRNRRPTSSWRHRSKGSPPRARTSQPTTRTARATRSRQQTSRASSTASDPTSCTCTR